MGDMGSRYGVGVGLSLFVLAIRIIGIGRG